MLFIATHSQSTYGSFRFSGGRKSVSGRCIVAPPSGGDGGGRWPSRSGMYADGTGAKEAYTRWWSAHAPPTSASPNIGATPALWTRSFVRSYQIQSTAALPSSAAAFRARFSS